MHGPIKIRYTKT